MCRNDDYNLAQSSVLKKNNKKKQENNKEKLLLDLRGREEDRVQRENDIMKELTHLNKAFTGVEKHLRKMIRKMLVITADA